jgi:hypothetical protein
MKLSDELVEKMLDVIWNDRYALGRRAELKDALSAALGVALKKALASPTDEEIAASGTDSGEWKMGDYIRARILFANRLKSFTQPPSKRERVLHLLCHRTLLKTDAELAAEIDAIYKESE